MYHDLRIKNVKGVSKVKKGLFKTASDRLKRRECPNVAADELHVAEDGPHAAENEVVDKRTTAQKAADLFRDECKFEILYWVHFLADTYEAQFGACKAMESQLRTFTGISPLVHVLLGKLEGMRELMPNSEVGLPGGLIKGGKFLQWFYKQWVDGKGLTFDTINIVYDVQPLEVRLVCFV